MNEVLQLEEFAKQYGKIEKDEKNWIEKIRSQLAENLDVGKPLRFNWFREKKFKDKRLFYLINESTHKALLLFFKGKKEQQDIITHIIANKEAYLELISTAP